MQGEGALDEGAAPVHPVHGLGVECVEPVDDGLAIDVDALADGPTEARGASGADVRVLMEVAGRRRQRAVWARVHGASRGDDQSLAPVEAQREATVILLEGCHRVPVPAASSPDPPHPPNPLSASA